VAGLTGRWPPARVAGEGHEQAVCGARPRPGERRSCPFLAGCCCASARANLHLALALTQLGELKRGGRTT